MDSHFIFLLNSALHEEKGQKFQKFPWPDFSCFFSYVIVYDQHFDN